jgi:hypothetical protein
MSLSLLSRLWSTARAALTRLRATIAPLGTLDAKERRHLRSWLRALEAFARRVVLLGALHLNGSEWDREPSGSLARKACLSRAQAKPALRLWPRPKPPRARIRQLGPPVLVRDIWRDQHRATLIARLNAARGRRRPLHIRLADRIDALENLLAAPIRAIRRLARKLTRTLALKLAMTPQHAIAGVDDSVQHDLQHTTVAGALALDSS